MGTMRTALKMEVKSYAQVIRGGLTLSTSTSRLILYLHVHTKDFSFMQATTPNPLRSTPINA